MALTRPKYSNIVDSDYKQSCRVVTTTDITLSGGAPDIYDGVSLAIGNRVLVAAQGTASQNGIYVVQTLGTGSNGTWVRSFDANDGNRLTSGTQVAIGEGTAAGRQYRLTTPDPITVGSTALTWIDVAGSPGGAFNTVQYNAGGSLSGASAFTFNFANSTVMANNVEAGNLSVSGSFTLTTAVSTSGNILAANVNTSGTANVGILAVAGPATVTGDATVGGNLVVTGDITVQGTTTTLNTETLNVEDLNVTLANGAVDSASANGAGLTVNGASATLLYTSATDSWNFNKQVIGQFTTTNLRATGGSVTGITGAASTFVSTNFSSGNAQITGGSATGITGAATTLVATNFSSGNAQITGGSATGITGAATTLVATNFSSGNAEITSSASHIGTDSAGAVSRVANVYANLGNFTDFSTANARLTGGSITGITGAASTLVATNFSSANLQATGTFSATENIAINSTGGATEGGQLVLAWKNITGITGQSNSTWNIDVNADNNLRIFYVDAGGAAAVPFTISQPGQIVSTPNLFSSNVLLGAGTASVSPLKFTSGTNLTTAVAGACEYDGRVFYKTTQGTERGLVSAPQVYVLNADRGLATATASQTLFNQTFKVTAGTRYYYEAFIAISKNNASANTLQYAIVVSGAVLAAHQYVVMSKWAAARTTVTAMNEMSNRITTGFDTLVSVSAASAAAAATIDARIQGYIDVTTGGTIDPRIALATNTTTTPLLLAQSHWRMYPVGPTSANTSIQ